jgi:hypothetical protein
MLGTKTWCTHGRPGRPCVHQSIMIPCITGRVGMLGTKTWCTHGNPGRPCVHQSIMIPCITGRVGMLGTKTWCTHGRPGRPSMHQSIIIQVPCISKWSWNAWNQDLVHIWASWTPIHAPVHYNPSPLYQ